MHSRKRTDIAKQWQSPFSYLNNSTIVIKYFVQSPNIKHFSMSVSSILTMCSLKERRVLYRMHTLGKNSLIKFAKVYSLGRCPVSLTTNLCMKQFSEFYEFKPREMLHFFGWQFAFFLTLSKLSNTNRPSSQDG